jgi:hypothetical protein
VAQGERGYCPYSFTSAVDVVSNVIINDYEKTPRRRFAAENSHGHAKEFLRKLSTV